VLSSPVIIALISGVITIWTRPTTPTIEIQTVATFAPTSAPPSVGLPPTLASIPTLIPLPSATITSYTNAQFINVKTGSAGEGHFSVEGISTSVASDPDLRLYVLVHPADPFAAGWWVQPAVVMDLNSGHWSVQAQIGNSDYPPHVDDQVDLAVVVTSANLLQNGAHVEDLKDVNPVAQSGIVRVIIRSIE
jgi:hypothetical protein